MKLEFETKNGAQEQKPLILSNHPSKPTPKLEFLGDKIESHIDPRMNDPEYMKKQLESLSNLYTHI